jgi:GNAT superfamily N-acetyltransferase
MAETGISTIRPVAPGEADAVVELVGEVLREFGLVFGQGCSTDEDLRRLPASYAARGGAFWLASDPGGLIGTCGVFPLSSDMFELRKMYLRPAARGRGIGKQLLDVAITWSRERGARQIVLDTIDEMAGAIAFYEAHGFVRDDAQIRGSRCTRGYVLTL